MKISKLTFLKSRITKERFGQIGMEKKEKTLKE